jgi:hypothetical protein
MKRNSPYYDLRFIVGCRWPGKGYYEPIAAFDVASAAEYYASHCWVEQSIPGFSYRVAERQGDKLVEIYKAEDQ